MKQGKQGPLVNGLRMAWAWETSMQDQIPIVLRREGEPWHQPDVSAYDNERGLQDLLLESPSLLPGVGAAVAVDEYPVDGAGFLDILMVEPSGDLSLVECKLAANSEVRRAVVGQILSYASALWQMSFEEFDNRFRQRNGTPVMEAIEQTTGHGGVEWDPEDCRSSIAENLRDGRFTLFVAVDRITDELRRIIEYLNTHTSPFLEVLALELVYVADQGVEILLPRTHGSESARLKAHDAGKSRRPWTVDEVFQRLGEICTEEEIEAVRQLSDDIPRRGGKLHGGRGTYPSMSGYVLVRGTLRAVWMIHADPSGPRLAVNFGSLKKELSSEELADIVTALEQSSDVAPFLERVREADFDVYPTIPLNVVAAARIGEQLSQALDPYLLTSEPPST